MQRRNRTTTTPEMELFATLVNNLQPLNIVTKSPIPDIAAVLNNATAYCIQKSRIYKTHLLKKLTLHKKPAEFKFRKF